MKGSIPQYGFSLLELMVVISIITVLLIIAAPMYIDNQKVVRRVLAQEYLLNIAADLNKTQATKGKITAADKSKILAKHVIPDYTANITASPTSSVGNKTDWTIVHSQHYIITATPKDMQAADGVLCLNNYGHRYWGGENNNICPMLLFASSNRLSDAEFGDLKWYGE